MRRLICSCAALALAGAAPCVALAQSRPGIPEAFHGAVTGAAGARINAIIAGAVVASTTVEAGNPPTYGYAPRLFIVPDPRNNRAAAPISFTIDGVPALQTAVFAAGAITELDLTLPDAKNNSPATSSAALVPPTEDSAAWAAPASGTSTPRRRRYNLTGGRTVGLADFSYLIARWGALGKGTPADINGDGTVDLLDFTLLLSHWSL